MRELRPCGTLDIIFSISLWGYVCDSHNPRLVFASKTFSMCAKNVVRRDQSRARVPRQIAAQISDWSSLNLTFLFPKAMKSSLSPPPPRLSFTMHHCSRTVGITKARRLGSSFQIQRPDTFASENFSTDVVKLSNSQLLITK